MKTGAFGATTFAAVVALSAPATAQSAADDLLAELKSLLSGFGQTFEIGEESRSGDTLTLRDVTWSIDLPEDAGKASIRLDWIEMEDVGGQTVAITYAPEITFVNEVDADGDNVNVTSVLTHEDSEMSVAGPKGDRRFTATTGSMTLTYDRIVVDGEVIPFKMTMHATDQDSAFSVVQLGAEKWQIAGAGTVGGITMNGRANNPDNPLDFAAMTYEIGGYEMTFDMTLVPVSEDRNPFADGLAVSFELNSGPASYSFDFSDRGKPFSMAGSSSGSEFGLGMSAEEIGIGFRSDGGAYKISGAEIPLPEIEFGYDAIEFSFGLPLGPAQAPVETDMLVLIENFTIGELIWGIFDPGQVLPRDPASAKLDIRGSLMWLVDVMTPDVETLAQQAEMPALPVSVTLDEFSLSAVGVEAAANGAFEFDLQNPGPVPGMPGAVGSAEAEVTGAHGLLDKLAGMGLVPEDMIFGVRAMLGAFARPGDGADSLVTKFELTEDGQMLLNGTPLPLR